MTCILKALTYTSSHENKNNYHTHQLYYSVLHTTQLLNDMRQKNRRYDKKSVIATKNRGIGN